MLTFLEILARVHSAVTEILSTVLSELSSWVVGLCYCSTAGMLSFYSSLTLTLGKGTLLAPPCARAYAVSWSYFAHNVIESA